MLFAQLPASAASVGRAVAAFDNARPAKSETAWGRLVADAVRDAAKADVALVHAGVLQRGTLNEGAVDDAQIAALLSFPEDEIAVVRLTGAQLRAAFERAASAYPTASPAMLHVAGIDARFNANAPTGKRVLSLRVNRQPVADGAAFRVAMPISLAQGASGYHSIWNSDSVQRTKISLRGAIAAFVRARGDVAPDASPRFAAQ